MRDLFLARAAQRHVASLSCNELKCTTVSATEAPCREWQKARVSGDHKSVAAQPTLPSERRAACLRTVKKPSQDLKVGSCVLCMALHGPSDLRPRHRLSLEIGTCSDRSDSLWLLPRPCLCQLYQVCSSQQRAYERLELEHVSFTFGVASIVRSVLRKHDSFAESSRAGATLDVAMLRTSQLHHGTERRAQTRIPLWVTQFTQCREICSHIQTARSNGCRGRHILSPRPHTHGLCSTSRATCGD